MKILEPCFEATSELVRAFCLRSIGNGYTAKQLADMAIALVDLCDSYTLSCAIILAAREVLIDHAGHLNQSSVTKAVRSLNEREWALTHEDQ